MRDPTRTVMRRREILEQALARQTEWKQELQGRIERADARIVEIETELAEIAKMLGGVS